MIRHHRCGVRVAVFLATLGASATATAEGGFALDPEGPAPAGDRFLHVPDGRVRGLFEVHAAMQRTYAAGLRTGAEAIDRGGYGSADLSLALAEAVMLGMGLSDVVVQEGRGAPASGSLGDLRSTLRVTWLGGAGPFALATQLDVAFPTGDPDALASDGVVRFGPKAAASGTVGPLAYAATGGWLARPERSVGDGTVGPGPTFGAAAALLLFDDALQIGPEIWGRSAAGANSTAVEGAAGLRLRAGDVLLSAAVGAGLTDAPGTADFRATFGVAFVRDERVPDPDGDGLTGPRDACPADPGLGADGCPDSDGDRDTIPDEVDACPAERGLVHEDPRRNGCPPSGALPPP